MEITTITELYVFVLAGFVGYQVITRVPPLLHTPLMSATNAISAISVVGAMVIAGAHYNPRQHDPRLHRRRVGHGQCRRRVPDHRPHAPDVPPRGPRRRWRTRWRTRRQAAGAWCTRCGRRAGRRQLFTHGAVADGSHDLH